jgi:hypothetical protein
MLDDSTYREYSRAELRRARTETVPRSLPALDVTVTLILFLATVWVVLFHTGVLEDSW